jgi:hypothetical protein
MADQTDETTKGKPKSAYTGKDLPIGSPVRVSRLDTLTHLRAEHGRLYREARRREGKHPDATTALKLSQILNGMQRTLDVELLEKRLEIVEAQLKIAPNKPRLVYDADAS